MWLDGAVLESPEVRHRALERALEIAIRAVDGAAPTHLLIDPPLPRLVMREEV
jgi:hypothetical protein